MQKDSQKLTFSAGFSARWRSRFSAAQKAIDATTLRYCEAYMPIKTGQLLRSGRTNTALGSGRIVYKTPYARRVYYGRSAGALWFERMKAANAHAIAAAAAKEMKT